MPRKPPEQTRFKKGQSGNPAGRPPIPPEVKNLEPLTRAEYNRRLNAMFQLSRAQLKAILDNPESTILDLWMAKIAAEGVQKGDQARLEGYLARAIGKVKDEVDVQGTVTHTYSQLSDAEVTAMALESLKKEGLLEGK